MLKTEHTEVSGWKAAIRGMRNPMNSWDRSDSYETHIEDPETLQVADFEFFIGEDDLKLMKRLAHGGSVHAKYRRMINVTVDITAPLYWWKEFDTYKVGTVANSCSTMHKIHAQEFTLDDFSHDHLDGLYLRTLENTIAMLNSARDEYVMTRDRGVWHQLIELLPSSYNQKRTVQMNYEVLCAIYNSRRDHKLTEWHTLCDWIKGLPYSELITA